MKRKKDTAGLDALAEICCQPRGNQGEDAFAYDISRADLQTLAVFDGCGGAGAWKYPEFHNATGAFVAAQSVAKNHLSWFRTLSADQTGDPDALAAGCLETTRRVVQGLKRSCAPMGVTGTLVKSFPCTASIALVTPGKNCVTLTALNAGDSRVYYLTLREGLVQLTRDDLRGSPDPMKNLMVSAPMSNLISADKEYAIRVRQVTLKTPCAVLCATDGVFGCARSPMHFERMLLRAMAGAGTVAGFEESFREELLRHIGDDATCLMAFYGWEGLKAGIGRRLEELEKMLAPAARMTDSAMAAKALQSLWETYRKTALYDDTKG